MAAEPARGVALAAIGVAPGEAVQTDHDPPQRLVLTLPALQVGFRRHARLQPRAAAPILSECCDTRSVTVLGVPQLLPFPGTLQAQKYLNALRRRGCHVSEGPDDLLSIELPGGLTYLARSFATLDGEAWTAICDAADAVGVKIASVGSAEDSAHALLELLDGQPSSA